MKRYKLTNFDNVCRDDGAVIPFNESNADYRAYLDWLDKGNIPEPAETRKEIVERVWQKIKTEREFRKVGGVKVDKTWFHSDDSSRIQQLGLVLMDADISKNLRWKTMNGTFVTMTQTLALLIFKAVAANDQAVHSIAEKHRVAMQNSVDPASYDYSAGWPKVYRE